MGLILMETSHFFGKNTGGKQQGEKVLGNLLDMSPAKMY